MTDQVIVLSDSEESMEIVINDNKAVFVPSFGFHDHDLDEAEYLSDTPDEEVKKIDRAGPSRYSELLGKYNNDERTTQKTDNRKEKNVKKKIDTASVSVARQPESSKLPERQLSKNMQPGECMKFVTISIDKGLTEFHFAPPLLKVLHDHDISSKLVSLLIPNSIMWKTEFPNENSMEDFIVIIWNSDEAIQKIRDGNFTSSIENTATLMPDKRITLVIYGMGEYFRYRKNSRGQKQKTIRKEDLEMCLTEIQLLVDCSSRLLETSHDISLFIHQMTKAIAEKPFKLEKRRKFEEKIDWHAAGYNRDTVKVDKNGNGLKRLWQQQLCQFNLASLETAEAITSVYPIPFLLMQAYRNATVQEGEKLLSEIPIRRAAGPLSLVRKIGPELSRKIFIAFTSEDGNAALV